MTEKQALAASISHWKANLKKIKETIVILGDSGSGFHVRTENGHKKHIGTGASSCALCQLTGFCADCLIFLKTSAYDCEQTPYIDFLEAMKNEDIPAAIKAAEAEVKFLESLKGDTQ